MSDAPVKPTLLALLHRARQEERALVAGLSEAERAASGTPDRMSAKDLVAHVTAARDRHAQKLAAAARGEAPPSFDDHEDAKIFAEYQSRSWQEVEDEADRVFATLVAQVDGLSEKHLTDLQPDACEDERALWEQLMFPGVWHPYAHVIQFYQQRGDAERATRLQETLVEAVRRMNAPPAALGCALYNLACIYTTTGRPNEALALLPEALRLDPWLVEFSKQDSDLDTLRADPAFQALHAA